MKTSPAKLRVAFLDPGNAPDDAAFETMLDAAFAPVGEIFSRLRDTLPVSRMRHTIPKNPAGIASSLSNGGGSFT